MQRKLLLFGKITEHHLAGVGMCEVHAVKASLYTWRALGLIHQSAFVCGVYIRAECALDSKIHTQLQGTGSVRGDIRRAGWKHFKGARCFPPRGRRRRLITSAISPSPSPISHFLITGGRYRMARGESRCLLSPLCLRGASSYTCQPQHR